MEDDDAEVLQSINPNILQNNPVPDVTGMPSQPPTPSLSIADGPDVSAPAAAQGTDALPTFDDMVSQETQKLPTFDEMVQEHNKPYFSAMADAVKARVDPSSTPQELSKAQEIFVSKQPTWNIVKAFGQGYMDTVKDNYAVPDEMEKALNEAGLSKTIAENDAVTQKSFMDGTIIPILNDVYGGFSRQVTLPIYKDLKTAYVGLMEAPYEGTKAAVGQAGAEFMGENARSDTEEIFDAAGIVAGASAEFYMGEGFHDLKTPPPLPRPVAEAKAAGVLEDDAVFFGLKDPSPEQTTAMQEAAEMYPDVPEVETAAAKEPSAPPTVHEIARTVNPSLFSEYDALSVRRDTYGKWIDEAVEKHADTLANTENPFTAQAKEIQDRIDAGASPFDNDIAVLEDKMKNGKRYRRDTDEALQDLKTKKDDWVAENTKTDQAKLADVEKQAQDWTEKTAGEAPGLQKLQEKWHEAHNRMMELSPEVTNAYKEAHGMMPEEAAPVVDAAPEAAAEAPAVEQPAAETPAIESPIAETPAPVVKPINEQKASIMTAEIDKLKAAGRPDEYARAEAKLVADHYEARAARFKDGTRTAEDLYKESSSNIKSGKAKKSNGKYSTREGKKSTITLMESQDASTFMHEKSHEWFDELMNDAKHPDATDQTKADAKALMDYAGADEHGVVPVKGHEKVARSFERYLMEGVAPSKSLSRVFEQFKGWLTSLYKTAEALKVPLTDDIRKVFDRMLTHDGQGVVVAADHDLTPLANEMKAADAIAPTEATVEGNVAGGIIDATEPNTAPANVAEVAPKGPKLVKESETTVPIDHKAEVAPSGPNDSFGIADKGLLDKAGNIRLDNLNVPESVKQALLDVAARNEDFAPVRQGVISDDQRRRMADSLGLNIKDFNPIKPDGVSGSVWAEAVQNLAIQSADASRNAAAKAAETGNIEDIAAMLEANSRFDMIATELSGITAESGRTQRVFNKKDIDFLSDTHAAMEQMQKQANGMDLFQMRDMAKKLASLDTPGKAAEFLQNSKKASFSDKILEYWVNSLLSGPTTHIKNLLGNFSVALSSVLETGIAAQIGNIRHALTGTEDRVMAGEAMSRAFGILQGAKDGLIIAKNVLKDEDYLLSTGNHTVEQTEKIKARMAIKGVKGEIIRIPTRLLGAEDEFFKAIAYRQEINALAHRTATKEGLTGDAFNTRLTDIIQNPSPEVMEQAVKNAEYQTFTNNLGDIGKGIQALSNAHPALKFIIPFVRTPTNILKYAGERTPVGLLSQEIRDNILGRNGGVAKDTQIARLALGTTVSLATMALAIDGTITGGGPSDPKARSALRLTGWQPYSVKVGDVYYSYSWLDPLSTIMGVSADMHDIVKSGMDKDTDLKDVGMMLVKSTAKNLMSKLSLRGAADFIQMVSDPDRYGEQWVQQFASSFVPSALSQTANAMDPTMRQTRTVMDAIKNRIPVLREDLEPIRDIWGEPITRQGSFGPDLGSPIYESRLTGDPVTQQLIKSGYMPATPKREIKTVPLNDQQYDDYSRLSGRLAKQRLNSIMSNPGFSQAPPGIQAKIVRRAVSMSRQQAASAVMLKNPEIMQQAIENKKRSVYGLKGVENKPQP